MFSAFRFIIKMWSLNMSILILGFVSSVYTETCPAKEDISPCECKIDYGAVKVTCSGLRFRPNLETLQQALSSLSGKVIYQFNLEEFNISIPSNLFSGIGIKKLELMTCHMDVLTNEHQPGLLGLENYLEELGIFTSITIQAKFYLGHLKKLKKITLSYNDIPELVNDWLSNDISSLEYLNIEGNNILKMGSNAFSQLNNLKELSLKDNRFGPIRRSMFPTTADRLEILDLDNNALTHLPEDIFSKMPAIQYVSFERNGITTLDESTWSPVWQQLKNINLYGNPTVCDDRLDWILKSKERPYIMALCSFPKKFENKDLREFFENRTVTLF